MQVVSTTTMSVHIDKSRHDNGTAGINAYTSITTAVLFSGMWAYRQNVCAVHGDVREGELC